MNDIYPQSRMNVGSTERLASLIGGGMALYLAMSRATAAKIPLAAGGSYLVYRALSGNDPVYEMLNIRRTSDDAADSSLFARRAVSINRPRPEVYAFWRNLENLPRFMEHLQSVTVQDGDGRASHWVTSAPFGRVVEWDAEIVDERENEWIEWRSLPGSMIENSGRVMFSEDPASGQTVVNVALEYRPPAGSLSIAVARLFGQQPWQQLRDDLRRFKQIMETGEIATLFGQTSGRIDEVTEQRVQLHGEKQDAWAAAALPGG